MRTGHGPIYGSATTPKLSNKQYGLYRAPKLLVVTAHGVFRRFPPIRLGVGLDDTRSDLGCVARNGNGDNKIDDLNL